MKEYGLGIFGSIGAILVPIFQYMYGEGETVLVTMILIATLIALDWIAGARAAKIDHSYASEYGMQGMWRTVFILMLPSVGHLIDKIFGSPGVIFGLFAFGLVYHILNSVAANTVRAGWEKWVPNRVIEWVGSEIENKLSRSMQRKEEREKWLKTLSDQEQLPKK